MLNRFVSIGFAVLLFAAPPAAAAGFAEALARELSSGALVAETNDETAALATLTMFYTDRGMQPAWVTPEAAGEQAVILAKILAAADEDALDPDDYGSAAIEALLGSTRVDLLAQLEVRLSMGLVRFAADLGQGRTAPNAADPELFPLREEVDKAAVIAAAAAAATDLDDLVAGYRPQTPRYDRLKQALFDYRKLAAKGGWAPIPDGPTLKPGMTDPRVPQLRDRLRLSGDLPEAVGARFAAGEGAETYDEALVAAVERMQWRHGLEADGVIGRKTLAALNVPVELRLEQIMLNLERRRWMPDDLGRRYVFVNLADFTLKVVDGEKTILDMRVVIGKPYHMTPVFSKDMTYIEINPYWNVPPSIAGKELLPKIKKNVNYLSSNKFEVFNGWNSGATVVDPQTVNWQRYTAANFPFKLRQGSGDGNALGRIKFMLPNHFSVYLHDTPAKALFAKAERSFSHGCIRVQHPPRLAEVLLSENSGWPLDRIETSIDSGERKVVTLAKPLPVHISYMTAWVNKDGSVHFRNDVYERDHTLAEALLGPRATRTTY